MAGTVAEQKVTIDKRCGIPVYGPVCTFCCHIDPRPRRRTCKAFPGGIPEEIWLGTNDHRLPFPGDGGMTFAPAVST